MSDGVLPRKNLWGEGKEDKGTGRAKQGCGFSQDRSWSDLLGDKGGAGGALEHITPHNTHHKHILSGKEPVFFPLSVSHCEWPQGGLSLLSQSRSLLLAEGNSLERMRHHEPLADNTKGS